MPVHNVHNTMRTSLLRGHSSGHARSSTSLSPRGSCRRVPCMPVSKSPHSWDDDGHRHEDATELRRRIECLNEIDTEIVCLEAKETLVREFAKTDADACTLRSVACDSELMRDLFYIRDVYTSVLNKGKALGRARRVLFRRRVSQMLERHGGDDAIVSLLRDLLESHGAWDA